MTDSVPNELDTDRDPDFQNPESLIETLEKAGLIVPPKDAAPCPHCRSPLQEIDVTVVLDVAESPVEVDRQTFSWAPGLHQYHVAPSFFRFVSEGWAHFEVKCVQCGFTGIDLEIVEEPHGLRVSDATRMSGTL